MIKTANKSLENVAEFICLVTTVTNKDCMLEEMKIKFRECLLPFGPESCVIRMLSKNVKIKICKTIILPIILYGCENLALAIKERKCFLWP